MYQEDKYKPSDKDLGITSCLVVLQICSHSPHTWCVCVRDREYKLYRQPAKYSVVYTWHVFCFHCFHRGEGLLKTTQDLFHQAEVMHL